MYEDPVIKAYIALFKAKMEGAVKQYYQGDPFKIAASELPCLLISKSETRVGHFTNSQDEHGIEMQLTLITDIRSELSTQADQQKVVAGVAKLYELVEGRDADYTLKSNTILDVLRSNQLVDGANNLRTDLDTVTRVDYGEALRDRDKGEWSIEARINFVAHFIQTR